jgi:5S rRNA maturation endonuclease (ribonuclease M5)
MNNALCVVTKGTRMNGRVKLDVEKALVECDKLFLLTDPDEAGDKLAEMVLGHYPILRTCLLRQRTVSMLSKSQIKSWCGALFKRVFNTSSISLFIKKG